MDRLEAAKVETTPSPSGVEAATLWLYRATLTLVQRLSDDEEHPHATFVLIPLFESIGLYLQ